MTDREKFEAYFAPIAEGMKKCGVGAVGIARRKDNQWQGWQAALASQQLAGDGWIEWKGGDQPVEDYLLVETKWTDGSISYGEASRWRWSHKSLLSDNNLIAYRVVKP